MKKILLLIIFIPLFYSCSTDFDVNDEWQDVTIVYCLLNQNDSVHYAKVNKAFLGNQDAYEMAKHSDSLQYNSDISVTLERWEQGKSEASQIIYLEETTDIIKDTLDIYGNPGIFATDNNFIYKTNETLYDDSEYKLVITIPTKDEIVTSTTGLISKFTVLYPVLKRPPEIQFEKYNQPFNVKWQSAVNGRLYVLKIRFNYFEIENNDTIEKHIDWVFPSQLSRNLREENDLADDMNQLVNGESFFEFVSQKIDENPNVTRIAKDLDFVFDVGGEELYTYIQVSKPSNSIAESKPEYTNIINGKGIFSCKFNKTIEHKELSPQSIDSLAYGKYTKDLRFVDHVGAFDY